jgi:hypothetical protein
MKIIGRIDSVPASEPAEIRRRIRDGVPTIITGEVERWPSFAAWTPAALLDRVGAARVSFRRSPSDVHPAIEPGGEAVASIDEHASLREYLGRMACSPNVLLDANLVRLFARRGPINAELAPLAAEIALPRFVAPSTVDTIGLWLSGRGVRTRLHYDRNGRHNFTAQLRGEKELVIVNPDQVAGLYPLPLTSPLYNFTAVDSFDPDLARYPRFADVRARAGTLRAGELLFIPAFSYHSFTHTGEFNLNVNFWCDAPCASLSAVALRNEVATLIAAASAGGEPAERVRWRAALSALEHHCLAWSPSRASADELGAFDPAPPAARSCGAPR